MTKIIKLRGVKKIVVVASCKGGVGKSLVTALLASKASIIGKAVGILDADIYGPSMPNLFGVNQKPEIKDGKMIPITTESGIKINSMGFLVNQMDAISMRGPMVSKALHQLLSLTDWTSGGTELDYLFIDTPPGTGDLHISLLQNYFIDEVLIVTTPQKISEIDVVRTLDLYKKFGVNIMGIIENMSYFEQEEGVRLKIFHGSAASDISKKYNIPVISKIPINPLLSEYCDMGFSLDRFTNLIDLKL